MGTHSTAGSPVSGDEKSQNPTPPPTPPPAAAAPVTGKPFNENKKDSQNSRDEAAAEAFKRSISAGLEQPMREEQVQNAVKFLSHPKVRGSPVFYRRSFLEKKGLTIEEINEAFLRVPDPPSNAASVEAAKPTQGSIPTPPTSLQPQPPPQSVQTAIIPSSIGSMAAASQKPRIKWSHVLLAVGVIGSSGAGTALFFKNVVLPRLKAWICKVAKEEDHAKKKDTLESKLAAEAAEAAKAAASAAAVVAEACQDLLSAKSEEKKHFEAFIGLLDAQMKEMKSMRNSICNLEATRVVTYPQEMQIANIQSTLENGTTNNVHVIPRVDQSDSRHFPISSQEQKINGTVNGAARSTSAPAPSESMATPYPKSYLEVLAMMQRGETPPGIKPGEVAQQVQQNSYGQLQERVDGTISETQDNGQSSQLKGRSFEGSDPWWNRKRPTITEIEQEVEEPRLPSYGIGSKNWPGRGWVPPQTPSVAMPEAAEAIRKPKPPAQKQQTVTNATVQSSDREDEMAGTANSVTGAKSPSDGAVDGSVSEAQDNGQSSQSKDHSFDGPDPRWKLKTPTITEIEQGAEEPKLPLYGTGSKNWPGRDLVPPQPPSAAMPEAAEAIRRPTPPVQKQQAATESTVQSSRREYEMAETCDSVTGAESSSRRVVDPSHESEIQEEHAEEVAVH